MMEDHYLISEARNRLADALKLLLKAEIMDATDFRASHDHATAAVKALDELLQLPASDL